MAELAVPALVAEPTTGNVSTMIAHYARTDPGRVLFSRRVDGQWQDVSAATFADQVDGVARGLIAAGVHAGDRVGLMSATRYEWTLVDFAIWSVGAVTVPIYETSAAEQVRWILADSEAVAVVVETSRHRDLVEAVRDEVPALRNVWELDAAGLDDLVRDGSEVDVAEVEQRRRDARPDDLATLIYTSGTTGRPKGCELTHRCFMTLCDNAVASLGAVVSAPQASTLLFLPLAHVFARFVQVLAVTAGARLGHTADVKNLAVDLSEFQPTFILAVPRVFEKIYNAAEARAEAEGKGKIFRAAADTAIEWSRSLDTGGPSLGLRVKHTLFDHLVYTKLRASLGGKVQYAVSGGAPLGERLGHFFRGSGIVILEGYGLTETTAPTSVCTPDLVRIGTVGPPLPGVSIRIADDSEVLIRGPHVMRGYWRNPEASAQALVGGWFRTGDLGRIDDGCLVITGRKKEILVTAGGKNVAPAVLEDPIRAHPLISQCMVVGDQKPFIAALVTLDPEMVPVWSENHGLGRLDATQAAADPTVQAEIQRAIDTANQAVSKAESIRKFHILPIDFTEETGYLTPSLKLRRSVVMKDFSEQVAELYR